MSGELSGVSGLRGPSPVFNVWVSISHYSTWLVRTEPHVAHITLSKPVLQALSLRRPFPTSAPQKNLLYFHVQKLHQSVECAHLQEQKDVVAHPGLHLCLRATLPEGACKHRAQLIEPLSISDWAASLKWVLGSLGVHSDLGRRRESLEPPSASSPWQ